MADNIIGAIREEELGNLSMEVLDYAERIALLFERIDEKFNSVAEFYDSESYVKLMESYNEFRANYTIVKSNIESYSDDFIRLISKMHEGMDEVSLMFEKYTEDRRLKAKEII